MARNCCWAARRLAVAYVDWWDWRRIPSEGSDTSPLLSSPAVQWPTPSQVRPDQLWLDSKERENDEVQQRLSGWQELSSDIMELQIYHGNIGNESSRSLTVSSTHCYCWHETLNKGCISSSDTPRHSNPPDRDVCIKAAPAESTVSELWRRFASSTAPAPAWGQSPSSPPPYQLSAAAAARPPSTLQQSQ